MFITPSPAFNNKVFSSTCFSPFTIPDLSCRNTITSVSLPITLIVSSIDSPLHNDDF